jgi:UDP-N-acetylmuramyl tripeptide synthase
LPADRLEVISDLEQALDRSLELTDAGDRLVVLPTYTAMLALRGFLTERGIVNAYWDSSP